ncbi:protein disulfide-isomerase A6-like isoform X2 [Gigantopelta aegis]|uniref:protein disulfide-isomerase A6-like isoform X2 n=1 Tax=Gigantopelta aegis TaxID=1735272 RepID=UPI001B88CD3F|nr:protein disulfide-isomerase A6-like isoform X2 [Gigantopelta aegis]
MMFLLVFILHLGTCLCNTVSLYDDAANIVQLTQSNFNDEVILGYQAIWNKVCVEFAPVWKRFSELLQGLLRTGVVNADQEKTLVQKYEITEFPTVKIFLNHEDKARDYTGLRRVKSMLHDVHMKTTELVHGRLTPADDVPRVEL